MRKSTSQARKFSMIALCFPCLVLFAGPSRPPDAEIDSTIVATDFRGLPRADEKKFVAEDVATGLNTPWAIAVLPSGDVIFNERSGKIRYLVGGNGPAGEIPHDLQIYARNESGLLGLVLHPQFADNRFIYLSYTAKEGNDVIMRVLRYRLETNWTLTDKKIILDGLKGGTRDKHFGGGLAFGLDGCLYIGTGERAEGNRAQQLSDLAGKVLRLNDDGSIPQDNPFVQHPGARPEIFSYGHRNPEVILKRPETGQMIALEHGPTNYDAPKGGDEVNILRPGANYGWPLVWHNWNKPGLVAPVVEYTPSFPPGGGIFYTGKLFPDWNNSLFIAGLGSKALIRVQWNGDKIAGQELLFYQKYGRLRGMAEDLEGRVLFATSNEDGFGNPRPGDDRIIRLRPVP